MIRQVARAKSNFWVKRVLALLAMASAAMAQTTITAVLDGCGNTADIAQGSVLVVKGTGLSAAGYVAAQAPLYQTTLNDVQITFTAVSGGGVVDALLFYSYNLNGINQLGAILPSTTPVGAYDVRVRNGASTSAAFRTNVVARKPGIATANGSGSGPAQATLGGQLILLRNTNQGKIGVFDTRPAHPGERVDLWGTGLGPDAASDTGGTSGDQTAAAAIRVLVDGVEVTPLYAGRAQGFPGLDQIAFNLPANVTLSCTNSIQVRAGGVLSNLVTIASSTGDSCPASSGGGGGGGNGNGGTTPTQEEIDSWISRGSYTSGTISLTRSTIYTTTDSIGGGGATTVTTTTKSDSFSAEFSRLGGADLGKVLRNEVPPGYPNLTPTPGNCVVYDVTSLTNPYPNFTSTGLDAGPQITSNGPNGTQLALRQSSQANGFSYNAAGVPNTYLNAGKYTLSGPGGADVGAFSGTLDIVPDLVVSNNPDDFKVINRSGGVTVRWTGGEPSTVLTISGASTSVDLQTSTVSGHAFVCIQNVSAGQFTVPASVLSQLPPSPVISAGGFSFATRGAFFVTARGAGARFTAPAGLDILTAINFWSWGFTPLYQ